LSRGARLVVSVEKANRHASMIRENLAATGLPSENYQLRVQDVFTAIGQLAEMAEEFDLILADPPFGEKNVGRRSNSLSQSYSMKDGCLLTEIGGALCLGHTKRDTLTIPNVWNEVKVMKHGDSMMRFLRRAGKGEA